MSEKQRLASPPTAQEIGAVTSVNGQTPDESGNVTVNAAITLKKTTVPASASSTTNFNAIAIPAEIPDTSHIVQIYASTYGYGKAPIGWVATSGRNISLGTIMSTPKSSTGGFTLEGLQSDCVLTILYYVEE